MTKYTEDHVWVEVDGDHARIGITAHAQDALRDDPSLANTDPQGAGWFFKVKLTDAAQLDALMDESAYAAFSS